MYKEKDWYQARSDVTKDRDLRQGVRSRSSQQRSTMRVDELKALLAKNFATTERSVGKAYFTTLRGVTEASPATQPYER